MLQLAAVGAQANHGIPLHPRYWLQDVHLPAPQDYFLHLRLVLLKRFAYHLLFFGV